MELFLNIIQLKKADAESIYSALIDCLKLNTAAGEQDCGNGL